MLTQYKGQTCYLSQGTLESKVQSLGTLPGAAPFTPQSPLPIFERTLWGLGGCGCLGGRILPGCWPLQDFTLPAKGRIPVFAFCILHLGANRLKHPKETKTSYRKWQRRQQGSPVFKPLAPRMTALQSLGTPKPRGLAVVLTCFSWGPWTHRDCRSLHSAGPPGERGCPAGPGLRAQVRGATAPCGRRHIHCAGHRPLPPPLAQPPAQEDSPRRPLVAEARLQPLSPALPAPGCIVGNVVRSSLPPAALWGGAGRAVLAKSGAGPDPGQDLPHPAAPSFASGPGPSASPEPKGQGGQQAQTPRPLRPGQLEVYFKREEETLGLFPLLTVEGQYKVRGWINVI